MAESFIEYASRGRGPYPFHALEYLDVAHLTAEVDDVVVSATFDEDSRLCTLAAAAATGTTVRLRRTTPKDQDDRVTQYLDLPDGAAGLTAELLDQDYLQTLFILGEARDVVSGAGGADGMFLNNDGHWAAQAKRITNLTTASDPNDLITKAQLDGVDAATTQLPTVSGADNDDGLFVASAAWAKRLPAQCRTHLGLGSVATLTAGTGANNVVQLDASARYPTADGRNIDVTAHPDVLKRALATVAYLPTAGTNYTLDQSNDPAVSTWSQDSTTRINVSTAWGSRVELNNGTPDVDGSNITPYRIRLTAGTWRIRFIFKMSMNVTASAANRFSFRITDDDDTSSQTIYYDLGLQRPSGVVAGNESTTFVDTLVLKLASAGSIVFRGAQAGTSGTTFCRIAALFHRISASSA